MRPLLGWHALLALLALPVAMPSGLAGLAVSDALSSDAGPVPPAVPVPDHEALAAGPAPGASAGAAPLRLRLPSGLDGLRVEPGVQWTSMAPGEYTFHCPQGPGEGLLDVGDPQQNVIVVRNGCPFRIIDDGDLLGSPQLAVRHDDVREVAFFSLHGAAAEDGPTPRSRAPETPTGTNSGQTHTVFTSYDGGWTWWDNPYGNSGYGEATDGIMTRDGHMFVASLFSKSLGADATGQPWYDYHVRLHEENTVRDYVAHRGPKFDTRATGNQVEEVNLVLVTPPRFVETAEQYQHYVNSTRREQENGTPRPSNETQVGNYAIEREPGNHSADLVAAVWHERAHDWRNTTTGKSSWIHVMWRSASEREEWTLLPKDQLVGPCRAASNPVAWNGRIYVACVVDAGYAGRRDARIGDIDIWSIDPIAGKKQFMAHVHDLGPDGRPRLAANDHGRFAITTTNIKPNGEVDFPSVELSFGWYGRTWNAPMDIGGLINEQWEPASLRDARVTAMEIVRVDSQDVLFLSFIERLNGTINSSNPAATSPVEYRKLVGSWEHCKPVASALYDLNVGVVRHPFEEGLVNDLTGVFDDLHDGIAAVHDPASGMHRVHFAYGDHGVIQYGIIDGRSAFGDCDIERPPFLYVPPPVVPQAVLLPSGVGVGTATAAGTVAAIGLGSLLVAKRRVAVAAAVKAK